MRIRESDQNTFIISVTRKEMTDLIRMMLVEDDSDICSSYKQALKNNPKMRLCYVTDSERDAIC